MNQNNFFRVAELLKLWAEIHEYILVISEIEIENERETNVCVRLHKIQEYKTKLGKNYQIKVDAEHGVIEAQEIKAYEYKAKSYMVI